MSGIGRTERGLVSRKDGCRSGRAGFERGCIRDTARTQRGFIGDRYALQPERVIFYPIIPDQAIKIGREWAGVGRASGVNVALVTYDYLNPFFIIMFGNTIARSVPYFYFWTIFDFFSQSLMHLCVPSIYHYIQYSPLCVKCLFDTRVRSYLWHTFILVLVIVP